MIYLDKSVCNSHINHPIRVKIPSKLNGWTELSEYQQFAQNSAKRGLLILLQFSKNFYLVTNNY